MYCCYYYYYSNSMPKAKFNCFENQIDNNSSANILFEVETKQNSKQEKKIMMNPKSCKYHSISYSL